APIRRRRRLYGRYLRMPVGHVHGAVRDSRCHVAGTSSRNSGPSPETPWCAEVTKRTSAVRKPLNLAEGQGRTGRDRGDHFHIASGSASEVVASLQVAEVWGFQSNCLVLAESISKETEFATLLRTAKKEQARSSPSSDDGGGASTSFRFCLLLRY